MSEKRTRVIITRLDQLAVDYFKDLVAADRANGYEPNFCEAQKIRKAFCDGYIQAREDAIDRIVEAEGHTYDLDYLGEEDALQDKPSKR